MINQSFSYGYEGYPGCSFLIAGGESKNPEKVRDAIAEEAQRIARDGIDPNLWGRLKKGYYGTKVRGLNSFENLCVSQAQCFFAGVDFLRFGELFETLTQEDAQNMIQNWVTPERTALSVIAPKEGQV